MQRGFLPSRSMLANVFDTEFEAQMVLIDFKAAFPSLSHNYLLEVLHGLGVSRQACQLIRSLYHMHGCNILFSGQHFDGFQISAGIRQGCPLAPLLFALVIDLFLRR